MTQTEQTMSPALSRWRLNVMTATWLSYAGFYFCRKTFGIVKAPLKVSLGVDDFALAHIWTAYLIAYMLGQFVTAWLGRHLACRILLLVGMAGSIAANIAFGGAADWSQGHAALSWLQVAPSGSILYSSGAGGNAAYWWLFCFMIINGFAQATGWASNVGVIAHWTYRHERGTLMAIWATCYQLGSIGAKAFAAFMFGWLGLAWSFWGASVVLLGVWIFFYFFGKDKPEDVGLKLVDIEEVPVEEPGEEHDAEAAAEAAAKDAATVMRFIFAMGVIYFCFKFVRYAFDSWSALLLEENFRVATTTAGYLSTIYDWVGFLGVVVGGVVSDRVFKSLRAPVIFWMTLGMFFSTLLFWQLGTTSLFWFAICLGLIGFMSMGPDSLLSGVGAVDVGSRRMAVFAAGVINGLGSIGPIIQEEAIGYLKSYWGFSAVLILFVSVATAALIGTGLLWYLSKKKNFVL